MNKASVSIKASLAPKVSHAFNQNSLPVLIDLSVVNEGEEKLESVELCFFSDPSFFKPKKWLIDSLHAGEQYPVSDRDVMLDSALLGRLTESEIAQVSFSLSIDGEARFCEHYPVELLARNQWGGLSHLPELAAAFVVPNDPAVDRLLKKAAEVLRENGRPTQLSGYEGGAKRVWDVASSIWVAAAAQGLDYILPPAGFETHGQKVRSPGQILDAGLATCLDSTLLMCSALEQCGLNSLIVFTEGHAFAGVWLKPEEFTTVVVDDVTALRKRIQLNELLVFETTLLTQHPAVAFSVAVEQGKRQLFSEDEKFQMAIDVRRARLQRIRPLAGAEIDDIAQRDETDESDIPRFEEAPEQFDVELHEEKAEELLTPSGRLDRWQRKLLDLSLRNRLLNFRSTAKAMKVLAPNPGALEDLLADGSVLKLLPHPDLMEGNDARDREIYEGRTRENVLDVHALEALQRKQLFVRGSRGGDIDSRLTELYRFARSSLMDGGANTLFLAVGFLSWRRDDHAVQNHSAPLILIPVALKRKSVRSGFSLVMHDDEPRFNPTLLEMLRQDFNLNIPGMDGDLPKDDSGLDVDGIFRSVSHAIKDLKGWELLDDVVLSTFSFSKYLMWKDLCDRTDSLKENPVVRHLMDTPRDPYESGTSFPHPDKLDETYDPQSVLCPLPADSSQLSAVMAASEKKDFVLIGPPGTGKSQTIANLIAHNLAEGKTVLFVSEKMAALDVVYRRLAEVGLGDFCLELHSNKARKLDVIQQLGQAWSAKKSRTAKDWIKETERLKVLRAELNEFVRELHHVYGNGLSVFASIGRVLAGQDYVEVPLRWTTPEEHNEQALDQLREIASRLDLNMQEVNAFRNGSLSFVEQEEWGPGWQQQLLDRAASLSLSATRFAEASKAFAGSVGIELTDFTETRQDGLAVLARNLPKAQNRKWRFRLDSDSAAVAEQLASGIALVSDYTEIHSGLSTAYSDAVCALDLKGLLRNWKEIETAHFLKSRVLKRRVSAALKKCAEARKSRPDCGEDLKRLIQLGALRKKIFALDELTGKTGDLWAGLDTDCSEVQAALDLRRALLSALSILSATEAAGLQENRSALNRILDEAELLLEGAGALATHAARYLEEHEKYRDELGAFRDSAASSMDLPPEKTADACEEIIAQKNRLHAWCAWMNVRAEAVVRGLGSLVKAVENGSVPAGAVQDCFETNYCRWWLNATVDRVDVLRHFVSAEHEKRIADFRELDDRYANMTSRYIRARLCSGIPDQDEVKRSTEWGVLRHELQKKQRHLPLRTLMERIPSVVTKLAPCLLMSPLSIAQYLSAESTKFDLVVFDEASQIAVWDAIGAIARGKQVVMVGDPKQLPPTNFFNRGESEELYDSDVEGDLESILDECLGANLPTLGLSWHYRSRHESLIAFSNHRYYGGGLVTFPSPVTDDTAVNFRFVEEGVYEKGGARINKPEALAVVAHIVERLKGYGGKVGETIGVVTFNSQQQELIENLLDAERRNDPSLERFFSEDISEPVFVKNLESVQGDERDIIYFSITYGPDLTGAISMNFGPINRDGGERRLNVAVTRARHELCVFASLKPEQIDLSRTQSVGVQDLKHFMEFAERGPRALAEAVFGSQGACESPFEEAVAQALRKKGWTVHSQIGASAFRVDLGIVHPGASGKYLAGIECDGATYHRSATARDRDKIREAVLTSLGWNILRIWSTDWWIDSDGALAKVCDKLNALLESENYADPVPSEDVVEDNPSEDEVMDKIAPPEEGEVEDRGYAAALFVESDDSDPDSIVSPYENYSGAATRDPREVSASEVASGLVQIVETEGPMLAKRAYDIYLRNCGIKRMGKDLKDLMNQALLEGVNNELLLRKDEWRTGGLLHSIIRCPHQSATVLRTAGDRSVEEIPPSEIRAAACYVLSGTMQHGDEEHLRAILALFGLKRLTEKTREKLVQAVGDE